MRYLFILLKILAIGLFAFIPFNEFKITGVVKDQKGKPLAGVTITEKNTHNGVTSGADGSFSLAISKQKSVLIFSMIGYDQKEITVNANEKPINIILKTSKQSLSEVVVAAYGLTVTDASAPVRPLAKRSIVAEKYATPSIIDDEAKDRTPAGFTDTVGFNTEEYDVIVENPFLNVTDNPLSTFSIDVDAGSYSNVRRFLQRGELPPTGAVRIEELINYFHYDYPQPVNEDPFSINTELGVCPWNNSHKLAMVGLQGKKIPTENLPPSNLVFLIDVSGSMMEPEKLPLVQTSLKMLVDQLREKDRVSLVVYAGNAGLVLGSTPGSEKIKIKNAIDGLEAGGSTAGGAGIELAYKVAEKNFITNGNNRVILCTDGDFNVGPSSDSELDRIIEKEKKTGVFLTVLGYGMGNYKDSKMEKLADKGNGNHAYIDNELEAKKVLINEFGGTLFTIAKDVKLQVELNPAVVQAYRLIGYENRMLSKEDFNDDKKDAGELGSGHTVTALYEIIPVGVKNDFERTVDPLKYQNQKKPVVKNVSGEVMTIKFRYKRPDGENSNLIVHTVGSDATNENVSNNFEFVTAVAEFGMLLRNSTYKQDASFDQAHQLAQHALGEDKEGYRKEFIQLVEMAHNLASKTNKSEDLSEVLKSQVK